MRHAAGLRPSVALGLLAAVAFALAVPVGPWLGVESLACHSAVVAAVSPLSLGALCLEAPSAGDDASRLVAEGKRLWSRSPDPGNPVACATCHWDIGAVRSWAPSFPKFKPLPAPAARVMSLLQANAEAVERHYRASDPLSIATAITPLPHGARARSAGHLRRDARSIGLP